MIKVKGLQLMKGMRKKERVKMVKIQVVRIEDAGKRVYALPSGRGDRDCGSRKTRNALPSTKEGDET